MTNKSANPLLQTLIEMAGQEDDTITIYRPMVEFLNGSLEAAIMLSRLLFWASRSTMNGWVAKSDIEFKNELSLTRYSVRKARGILKKRGLIETDKRKFYGAPTQHYKVLMDIVDKEWSDFLPRLSENRQSIVRKRTIKNANSDNHGLSENEQSLTESLSPHTPLSSSAVKFFSAKTGKIEPDIAQQLGSLLNDNIPPNWVDEAVAIASAKGKHSAHYVIGILNNWKQEGRNENSKSKLPRSRTSTGTNRKTDAQSSNSPNERTRQAAEIVNQRNRERRERKQTTTVYLSDLQ